MNIWNLRRWVIGNPLHNESIEHEKLSKRKGLAVLSSDALSSTAYATEEILRVLILASVAGLAFTLPISIAIVALILIVGFSYYRTIHAYPNGGGAYVVAQQNLGRMPSLIAASALLTDYALTVAVSICAGVAAVTSALPALLPFRVELGIIFVGVVTVLNLRGVRESGTIFAIPTFMFIGAYGLMVLWGLFRVVTGDLPQQVPIAVNESSELHALSLFLILKAFASGSSALTGIEAISNGVQAFHRPQARNASIVLFVMIGILALFFLSTSYLAYWFGIVPGENETVVSQIARGLFGTSYFYYAIQFLTSAILFLAANTAFTGFPRLASILANDRFLPRQLTSVGDRLVFSNGILSLGLVGGFLILVFGADTHALVPLYMIGVFITFTISQAGMVKFWRRERTQNWWLHLSVNGLGAVCTAIVGLVVFVVKFTEGAWITLLAISAIVVVMLMIRQHYEEFLTQLTLGELKPARPFGSHKVVIPVSDIHRGVIEAVRYAMTISADVSALYVDLGNADRLAYLQREWAKWVPDVPIVVLRSPFRSVVRPIVDYLDNLRDTTSRETAITVVIPEFVPVKWWHHLLHNQTALTLRFALLFHRHVNRRYKVLADVPYYLRR